MTNEDEKLFLSRNIAESFSSFVLRSKRKNIANFFFITYRYEARVT